MQGLSRRSILGGLAATLAVSTATQAKWKQDYAQFPEHVQNWYRAQEVNPEVRRRLGLSWKSCCDNADVVQAKFEVDRTTGADVWKYQLPDGKWKRIPDDVIHWDSHEPDGKATLFMNSGREVCFFPPLEGN